MKLGVISDTHDNVPAVEAAMDRFEAVGVESVVHCGDFIAASTAGTLSWVSESTPTFIDGGSPPSEKKPRAGVSADGTTRGRRGLLCLPSRNRVWTSGMFSATPWSRAAPTR